jgi:hypothetical protein
VEGGAGGSRGGGTADASVDAANVDGRASDGSANDRTITDVGIADIATSDIAIADMATPDIATSDIATTDVATPDVIRADVASTDARTADAGTGDSAPPADATPDITAPCSPTTCPTGCCSNGQCVPSTHDTCGMGGGICLACLAGQQCSAGGACICNASSCAAGCCNGATCVPYASETNAMCGSGGAACAACASGTACNATGVCAPNNWCSQQTIPSGVLAADYQCVDFESGLPPASVWPATLSGGGTMEITQARAASLPNALSNFVPAASDFSTASTSILTFSTVGSAAVTSVSVSASLNTVQQPGVTSPWTGGVDLLCVSFGFATSCLQYTRGADTTFGTNYTGLLVDFMYTGGPAYSDQCEVTGTLPTGVWTRVELRLTSTGAIDVLINGTSALATTCSSTISGDTVGVVEVGQQSHAVTEHPQTLYYDNIVAVVRR